MIGSPTVTIRNEFDSQEFQDAGNNFLATI